MYSLALSFGTYVCKADLVLWRTKLKIHQQWDAFSRRQHEPPAGQERRPIKLRSDWEGGVAAMGKAYASFILLYNVLSPDPEQKRSRKLATRTKKTGKVTLLWNQKLMKKTQLDPGLQTLADESRLFTAIAKAGPQGCCDLNNDCHCFDCVGQGS